MDWARWLRDFAIFGAVAVAAVFALRTSAARTILARVLDAVAAWSAGRALVIVLVATAIPRLAVVVAVEPRFETDVREYVMKAEAIADDGTPRRQEVRPDGKVFYRPLGSSLVLAGWYRATGTRGLLSARLHGVALACAAAWLLLALGRATGRVAEARLAALGYAAFVPHAVFATLPYTETFVTVLVLAISVTFERLRRGRGGLADAAAMGVAQGFLVITRTEMAWVAALTAGFLVWERRAALRTVVAPVAVSLAAACVPFVVNHTLRAGYPGHLRTSVQGGLILHFGNNPVAVPGHGNATDEVVDHVRALYEKDPTGALARDEAVAWMRDHPLDVLLNAPKKAFHLWLAEPQGLTWQLAHDPSPTTAGTAALRVARAAAYAQSLIVLALGVLGWRFLGPERRLWTATLALHLGVWCLLAASARNRYPLEPWLLLAAAARAAHETRAVARSAARTPV